MAKKDGSRWKSRSWPCVWWYTEATARMRYPASQLVLRLATVRLKIEGKVSVVAHLCHMRLTEW